MSSLLSQSKVLSQLKFMMSSCFELNDSDLLKFGTVLRDLKSLESVKIDFKNCVKVTPQAKEKFTNTIKKSSSILEPMINLD